MKKILTTELWPELNSTPSTPESGFQKPFFRNDGLYLKNSMGIESKLSTGLDDTGVIAGTYTSPNITVGSDGRITAISNGISYGFPPNFNAFRIFLTQRTATPQNSIHPIIVREIRIYQGGVRHPTSFLTSNNTPSPFVVSTNDNTLYPTFAYKVFDGSSSYISLSASDERYPYWIKIELEQYVMPTSLQLDIVNSYQYLDKLTTTLTGVRENEYLLETWETNISGMLDGTITLYL